MATKKTESSRAKKTASKTPKLTFIVSDEKSPAVSLKPGMKLDVVSVAMVSPTLKRPKAIGARLCGGSSTCLALVER